MLFHDRVVLVLGGLLAFGLSACVKFNLSLNSSEYFVAGGTVSPQLQFAKISSDKNSLELVTTVSTLQAWSMFAGPGILGVGDLSSATTFSLLGSSPVTLTNRSLPSGNVVAVSPDGLAFYYGNVTDTIGVRLLSKGVLPASNTQSLSISIGDEVTVFAFGTDTSFMVVGGAASNSASAVHAISRNSDGTLGGLIGSVIGNPDAVADIQNLPALGSEYFVVNISGGANGRLVRANRTSLALAFDFGVPLTNFTVHPTRAWIFEALANSSPNYIRYTVSTTGLTATSTQTVATRNVTAPPVFNSSGDRIVELANGNSLRLYSVDSNGTVAFLSSLTIGTASSLKRLPLGRTLP